MIDLSGVARHLRLSVDDIRIAAGLLEQGYQPAFIQRYRADETGRLSHNTLWALKLEIDRQQRLELARQRQKEHLPKGAELDEEAIDCLPKCNTEVEVEAALKSFRARRGLSQSDDRHSQASQLLETLIQYQGEPIADVPAWAAQQLSLSADEARQVAEQTARLVGTLIQCDTRLCERLRRNIQKNAQLRVQLHEQKVDEPDPQEDLQRPADAAGAAATESAGEQPTASAPEADNSSPAAPQQNDPASPADSQEAAPGEHTDTPASPGATPQPQQPAAEQPGQPATAVAPEASDPQPSAPQVTPPQDAAANASAVEAVPPKESPPVVTSEEQADIGGVAASAQAPTSGPAPAEVATGENAASTPETVEAAPAGADSSTPSDEANAASGATTTDVPQTAAKLNALNKKRPKKGGDKQSGVKAKERKPLAKMTPRQRRRRWLMSVLTPMKSLKRPLSKLTAYQQLMLGRGRRSNLVSTELQYDRRALRSIARDSFVSKEHALKRWFEEAIEGAFEHSLLAKLEQDAVCELEELAAEKLLQTAADGLRRALMQRPVRRHCILVVDTIGPKTVSIAMVGPQGEVLGTDELDCSAHPNVVTQNVVKLGELVHKHRVTLVVLTNGPARRFMVHSVQELMKQSAESGLRWTMADRGGADAYAAGRTALKELAVHNRRERAAIWIGRALQDPLAEHLKVDVNRLRLGSYQRELPQEPLKKLVRETISDCVSSRGVDAHLASVGQLLSVAGVSQQQAQQIATMAAQGKLESREQLLASVTNWPAVEARQAIGLLRVFESPQPLDGTLIHPDDYRLATRLIENTELETPAAAPDGWQKPAPMEEPPHQTTADGDAPTGEVAEEAVAASTDSAETASGAATTEGSDDSAASDSTAGEPSASATSPSDPAAGDEAATDPTEATVTSDEATGEGAAETAPPETAAASEASSEPPASSESDTDAGSGPNGDVQTQTADMAQTTDEQAATTGSDVEASQPTHAVDSRLKPEYPEDIQASAAATLKIDVEKLARGWQVGREKLRSITECLTDPFADSRLDSVPVPLLTSMPTLESLEPGQCVLAVVVGVADFGAFVELGPDCSGLIHISRLSSAFVEDPHQCVQVGDLVIAWVVSVDEKKNRVALTALSPAERERVEQESQSRRDDGGGYRRGGGQSSGTGGNRRGGTSDRGGAQHRGGSRSGGQRGAGQGGGSGSGGQRGGGDRRGGAGRDGRGGGRGRDGRSGRGRGDSRPSKPIIVTSKKPKADISDKMREGEEPLRSFSDLMQFYEEKRTDPPASKKPAVQAPPTEPAAAKPAASEDHSAPDATKPDSPTQSAANPADGRDAAATAEALQQSAPSEASVPEASVPEASVPEATAQTDKQAPVAESSASPSVEPPAGDAEQQTQSTEAKNG